MLAASCGDSGVVGGFPVGNLSDEEAIRQMDEVGKSYWEQEEYEAIYEWLSPEYRSACSSDAFTRAGRFGLALDEIMKSHPRDGEIVSVRVDGDRALVTSLDYSPARDELDEDTDEMVKLDGRWFFALDDEDIEFCKSDLYSSDLSTDASIAVFRFALFLPRAERDSTELAALVRSSFSERLRQDCSAELLAANQATLGRFRKTFEDPFSWEFDTSDDHVTINVDGDQVAQLLLEGGDWKIDTLAGLAAC